MKLFFHYCQGSFTNCYVLGSEFSDPADTDRAPKPETPRDAVLIDPGCIDGTILNFIENNNYTLRGVLVTHDHSRHVHGLQTLNRIYDTNIYAVNQVILDQKTIMVRDRDIFYLGPFRVEVISVPGHSSDSVVFKIDHLLFTGDVLTAGLVGWTASTYGAATQMAALRSKILSLPGDFTILPGHGPPSSLEAERRFNTGIQRYEQNKNQR